MAIRATSRTTARTALAGGLVTGFLVVLFGAALATAAPAHAVDDPSRPDGRVTHGPSCRPGGLVVEVVAGTAPYFVRLATTRTPAGEDEALLEPGVSVVLRTGDVDWGETIDGRLEYTARDGSGVTFVDELEEYSFTRPTREDCEAIAAPTTPEPMPPSSAPAPSTGADEPSSTPTEQAGGPPQSGGAPGPSGPPADGGTTSREVAPGSAVSLRFSGFLPGERITVALHGTGEVIATGTAGPDGGVLIEVRIPSRTAPGPVTVDVVGQRSDVTADVDLQVVGHETQMSRSSAVSLLSLVAAAVALVTTAAALVAVWTAGRAGRSYRSA